jgi:hypothetical protein
MTHFPFDDLPLDIKLDVFSYLNFKALFSRCAYVSKSWFKFCRDPRLRFVVDFRKALSQSKTYRHYIDDVNVTITKFIHQSGIVGSRIVVLNLANNKTLSSTTFRQLITFCASRCLKTVILTRCFNLKDEDIQFLAETCVGLEKVELDVIPITVQGVNAFVTHDRLKELSLRGCYCIDPESRILARRQDKLRPHPLEKLALPGYTSGKTIEKLHVDVPNLKVLTLINACYITNVSYSFLSVSLRELDLRGNTNLNDTGLSYLAARCSRLEKLILYRCPEITDNGISALVLQCTTLRHVDLQCNKITDKGIVALCRNCHQIQHVGLWEVSQLTDVAFLELANYQEQLKEFILHQPSFGIFKRQVMESLFQMLNRCTELTTLILDTEDIDAFLLKAINLCSSLKRLHISHCNASKKQWDMFSRQITNLTDLYISDIDQESLVQLLKSCKNLKSLNTGSTTFQLPHEFSSRIRYEQNVLRCHDLVPDIFEISSQNED